VPGVVLRDPSLHELPHKRDRQRLLRSKADRAFAGVVALEVNLAFGAADRMVFRSFSSAARLSSLKAARYSSTVLGLVPVFIACSSEVEPTCSTRT
jgi:hypothetical protein